MADNQLFNNQNVYVETDYENIIIVDPNKVVDKDNKVQERLVNHEELVKYVNLEAKVLPRTKLVVGDNFDDVVENLRIGTMSNDDQRKVNFVFPEGKDGYDTSWTEEITGNDSLAGKGLNQTQVTEVGTGENKKVVRKILNPQDTQLLGITNVQIKINTAFAPQVTIEMVDVQGRTLFEQGENSPYSAFMQLPYPLFVLTIKGYFGKAVKYELMLKDFTARFDSSDGNYKITTNYIARTYAILSDISINNLYTFPHMYQKTAEIEGTTTTQTNTSGLNTTDSNTLQSTKGLEILKQVYSDYRSKGLIGDDFPNQQNYPLTLPVLEKKLDNFERYIMETYGQEDMAVLNDISEFTNTINNFRRKIFGANSEWFSKNIDTKNVLIPLNNNESLLYPFKKELGLQGVKDAMTQLTAIVDEYNEIIKNDATFGDDGSCVIQNEKIDSSLTFSLSVENFTKVMGGLDEIDIPLTYAKAKGRITDDENLLQNFRSELLKSFEVGGFTIDSVTKNVEENNETNLYIKFGNINGTANLESNTFLKKLKDLENKFSVQKKIIENKLSEALAEKIKSPDGLGFNPTIKNVMAVICANTDAFFRLMDNVHENAWNQRENGVRQDIILGNDSTPSVEGKDSVTEIDLNGNVKRGVVYPWPQYVEVNVDEKGNTEFNDKYPGDANSINATQAYRFDIWPEVEFVEEYIKAAIEIEEQEIDTNNSNEVNIVPYISVNALLFPFSNNIYVNKSIVPYFYEIFERTLISSTYTNLYKKGGYSESIYTVLGDFEKLNILTSSSDSLELIQTLKNYSLNYENFIKYLKSVSNNGSWNLYLRDEYVTPYIKNSVEKDYGIYNSSFISDYGTSVEGSTESKEKLDKFLISNQSDEIGFLDKYPFTNLSWIKSNLSNGSKINSVTEANSTKQIYTFIDTKKTISTFDINDNSLDKKLFTYFEWITNTSSNPDNDNSAGNIISNDGVINYYNNRLENKFILTESQIDYGNLYNTTVNNLTSKQTTSLLNTPYFINSISKGVENEKNGVVNPYAALGYLYLNSLPLSTLREKFKSFNDNITTELDYIFAGFNKYSAIHRIPYLWILKYGSIWHRYKKYHEQSVDILDDIWDDFDYVNAYDPVTNNREKSYTITNQSGESYTIKQKNIDNIVMNLPEPTQIESVSLNNGIYPKVINDVYWYFTRKNIFTNYTSQEFEDAYTLRNLNTIDDDTNRVSFSIKYDPSNPNRSLNITNWSQYFDIKNNTEFDDYEEDKILVIPSVGSVKFNQAKFECFNSSDKLTLDIIDNNSVYNGTVRPLWSAPNFGYFNNEYINKPKVNEYIKYVDPTNDNKQSFNLLGGTNTVSYSKIDELFNVFTKDMLDTFEEKFLNFCLPVSEFDSNSIGRGLETFDEFIKQPQYQELYVLNEETGENELPVSELYKLKAIYENQSPSYGVTPTVNPYDISLYSVIKSLLIVDKPTFTDNYGDNLNKISKTQLDSFNTQHKLNFLTKEVVLKIGNPGKYNRKVFDSFSNDIEIQPIDKYEFKKYSQGTPVPTSGGTTLSESISQNINAWNAMYLYVGEYEDIEEFIYKDTGSYLTDFFIDMDIEFSDDNIKLLKDIIKIYASRKKETNSQITSLEFITEFNLFLNSQKSFQKDILDHLFINLNKDLPNVTITQKEETGSSATDGELEKLGLWKAFQTINDKWISGQDFKTKTIFEDFLFLDRANRPVGDKVIIDIESLRSFLKQRNSDMTVYGLMGHIYEKNNFTFMPTPVYTNFYGMNDRVKEGEPIPQDIPNDTFGTFMEVDTRDTRPRMLGIYVGEPSTNLDMKENENVRKNSDSFDITIPSGNPLIENTSNKDNYSDGNRCVGFNVDFGTRNQGIFKSISLDMQQHKNIAPTFQVLADLGSQASGQKVAQQSQSLYNFYRSKSYTCQITSMGNAMIQPTMYFNLQRVPLFYGPYLIMSVSHTINSNDFVTQFEGIRVSKFSLQQPDKLVLSVNKKILESYSNKLKKQRNNEDASGNTENGVAVTDNSFAVDESRCEGKSKFPTKPFLQLTSNVINAKSIVDYLQNITTIDTDMKIFIYGITMGNKNKVTAPNNNLIGTSINDLNTALGNTYTNGQVCVKQGTAVNCLASFETYEDCLNLLVERFKNQQILLKDLRPVSNSTSIDGRANSMARLLYKNILKDEITSSNATQIKTEINNILDKNTETEKNYNNWVEIFKNSINKLS